MINQQIRPWEVYDLKALKTLEKIKREEFVPEEYKNLTFADTEIPLFDGENMLSPKMEAKFLQEASIKNNNTVLEIGTGSGYMAALLAQHAEKVTTVEISKKNKLFAEQNLNNYGIKNVTVELGDGSNGWCNSKENKTPWDVIVVSGGLNKIPNNMIEQLKINGRIVAVVGNELVMSACILEKKSDVSWIINNLFETKIKNLYSAEIYSKFNF